MICTQGRFTTPRRFVINTEINYFEFLNKKLLRPIILKVGSTYKRHRGDSEK